MSATDATRPARRPAETSVSASLGPARALAVRAFLDARTRTVVFAYLFAVYAYIQPFGYRHAYPTVSDRLAFARSFARQQGAPPPLRRATQPADGQRLHGLARRRDTGDRGRRFRRARRSPSVPSRGGRRPDGARVGRGCRTADGKPVGDSRDRGGRPTSLAGGVCRLRRWRSSGRRLRVPRPRDRFRRAGLRRHRRDREPTRADAASRARARVPPPSRCCSRCGSSPTPRPARGGCAGLRRSGGPSSFVHSAVRSRSSSYFR